jgi:glycosyltransferase involved in cell wall biosynthesis
MMRIAVNARLLIPGRLDGIGWFTFETVRRIARAHPEIEIHLLFDRPVPDALNMGPNVVSHYVLPPARRPVLFRWWLNYSIPFMLKKLKIDLFLSPDGLGSVRSPCPQLVVIHDVNFEEYPEDLPASYSNYLRKTTRQITQKADRIATVSEFSRDQIARFYPVTKGRIDVIHNGVNEIFHPLSADKIDSARKKYSSGFPYFIFISSIHPRKNLPRLLQAYDNFRRKSSTPYRLLVVGTSFWMEDQYKAIHRKMRYPEDVIFTGRLEASELAYALGGATGLAYVSYYEGFGLPLLEAFRSGVPVIASTAPALQEVAGDAAIYADPFSTESITQCLARIAADESLRKTLIQKGHSRVNGFSWDRCALLLWESIEKTMAGK